MIMNGEVLTNINDLKRCFSLEELLCGYYSGELEIFLDKTGEDEKAEQIRNISVNNALLLIRLYDILEIPFEYSEEKVRQVYSS